MSENSILDQLLSMAKASPPVDIDDGVLACPRCGGKHLHHMQVLVYDRREDASNVRRTLIECSADHNRDPGEIIISNVENENSGNPSRRRGGIVISFRCETCHLLPIDLAIAQHKGETLINWNY
jgi:hypothetical protein